MEFEYVERQSGLPDLLTDRLQALLEHIPELVTLVLESPVQIVVERRAVGHVRPRPHLGQEELEGGSQCRAGVAEEVVGDHWGQTGSDGKLIMAIEGRVPGRSLDRLDDCRRGRAA